MRVSLQWLQDFLPELSLTPERVAALLNTHSFETEVVSATSDDAVLEVDVLPNRSADCLSQRGVARELAAVLDTPLAHDPLAGVPALPPTGDVSVTIADHAACPRFSVSFLRDVKVGPSPEWLANRLRALGQRPINNVVDATNYVMYELGQPLHAYDADTLPGAADGWGFHVRYAQAGETVSLLGEGEGGEPREVTLHGGELVITDAHTDAPLGLAGVKGGTAAGVHEGTSTLLIEAASFDAALTRRTAQRHQIRTDAGKRFENGPSDALLEYAQAAVADLLQRIAGATLQGVVVAGVSPRALPEVVVRPERVNALLGTDLTVDTMASLLNRVGVTTTHEGGVLRAAPPFPRTDLQIEADFIEEVGRLYGYEHITPRCPAAVPLREMNARHYYEERIRAHLVARGFSEIITSSFRKRDQVTLRNPLAADKRCLRSSLVKNVAEALDRNAVLTDLLGTADTRVFEIGTVFTKGEGDVREHTALALGVRVRADGYSGKEDTILRAALDDLQNELQVSFAADVTIQKGVAEINLSALLERLPEPPTEYPPVRAPEITYEPYSVYPYVRRDIAFWAPHGTTADEARAVLAASAGEWCVRIDCFDEFTRDARTSLAFRLIFQSHERTLTDSEVNAVMERVYRAVADAGFEPR